MALTAAQQSARAAINSVLARYGLRTLGQWAWNLYIQGVPAEQIMLDLRDRPEYKARFPAMEALAKKGRAMSEDAYMEYEQRGAQMMRAYGLPAGFYDKPDDFAKFISEEVALPELEERLQMAQTAAYSAPQETRDALARLYGIKGGDLAAYWLNPSRAKPLLEQKFAAAQAAGAADRTGFGALTAAEAERIGQVASPDEAQGTFAALARMGELTTTLPGEAKSQLGRGDLLAAGFEGDAAATEKVTRQSRKRTSQFAGGGEFAGSAAGVSGLGTSDR